MGWIKVGCGRYFSPLEKKIGTSYATEKEGAGSISLISSQVHPKMLIGTSDAPEKEKSGVYTND